MMRRGRSRRLRESDHAGPRPHEARSRRTLVAIGLLGSKSEVPATAMVMPAFASARMLSRADPTVDFDLDVLEATAQQLRAQASTERTWFARSMRPSALAIHGFQPNSQLYLESPFFGSRRMACALGVNRKRIQRLMQILGIESWLLLEIGAPIRALRSRRSSPTVESRIG